MFAFHKKDYFSDETYLDNKVDGILLYKDKKYTIGIRNFMLELIKEEDDEINASLTHWNDLYNNILNFSYLSDFKSIVKTNGLILSSDLSEVINVEYFGYLSANNKLDFKDKTNVRLYSNEFQYLFFNKNNIDNYLKLLLDSSIDINKISFIIKNMDNNYDCEVSYNIINSTEIIKTKPIVYLEIKNIKSLKEFEEIKNNIENSFKFLINSRNFYINKAIFVKDKSNINKEIATVFFKNTNTHYIKNPLNQNNILYFSEFKDMLKNINELISKEKINLLWLNRYDITNIHKLDLITLLSSFEHFYNENKPKLSKLGYKHEIEYENKNGEKKKRELFLKEKLDFVFIKYKKMLLDKDLFTWGGALAYIAKKDLSEVSQRLKQYRTVLTHGKISKETSKYFFMDYSILNASFYLMVFETIGATEDQLKLVLNILFKDTGYKTIRK